MAFTLAPQHVHAWYVFTDQWRDPGRMEWCRTVLTPEEVDRCMKYAREKDRELYVIAHGLLRRFLSQYASPAPADWVFQKNRYGRPSIANPGFESIRFNLSHTAGMVAWIFGRGREVGIDVEDTGRQSGGVDLAERYFSPSEVADLMQVEETGRRRVFFDYWTLKESYIKARGMGLAIPLEKFSFKLAPPANPTISFAPDLEDDPVRWEFSTHSLGARHALALAASKEDRESLQIELREVNAGLIGY
ncbi:MAG: 4'-phosphopantetheinyl transferase superfamily protein [Planctomycetota bacterium]